MDTGIAPFDEAADCDSCGGPLGVQRFHTLIANGIVVGQDAYVTCCSAACLYDWLIAYTDLSTTR